MKKGFWMAVPVISLLFFFATLLPVPQAASIPRMPLEQGISPVALYGQHVGNLPGNTQVELAVILHLRNEAALRQLVAAQNTPGSPYYHRFLTPDQFAQNFSPTPQAYNAALSYFVGQGFQVEATPNRQLIMATGTSAQAERALGTQIDTYYYDGKLQYGNRTAPSLPSGLALIVKAVQGLDSREMHPHYFARPYGAKTSSPSGFSPNQIASAYDYPKLYGHNGAGRKMAVATAYNFNNSDISGFDSAFGIAIAGYTRIWVGRKSNRLEVETTIDIQQSTALANGAYEYVYSIPSPSFSNFTAEYNKIVTDNAADAVTSSWGACESSTGTSVMNQDDGIFAQGAAQGQSWFFAAGDSGAYDCGSSSTTLAVDYPASTPYATAASGTTLTLNSSGGYGSESAWSGSGGGTSSYESQPSWEYGSSYFSNGKRWLGDFSMDANPNTGMAVLYNGSWSVYGGTSFVAPFGCALAASISGYKGARLGIFAARINQLANSSSYSSVLRDVTSGNNGYYNAGPGWDPPTGWGSPDGYMMMLNF